MKGLNYYLFVLTALTAAPLSVYHTFARARIFDCTLGDAIVSISCILFFSFQPLDRSQALTQHDAVQRAFNLIRSPFCSSHFVMTTKRGTQTPPSLRARKVIFAMPSAMHRVSAAFEIRFFLVRSFV